MWRPVRVQTTVGPPRAANPTVRSPPHSRRCARRSLLCRLLVNLRFLKPTQAGKTSAFARGRIRIGRAYGPLGVSSAGINQLLTRVVEAIGLSDGTRGPQAMPIYNGDDWRRERSERVVKQTVTPWNLDT